MKKNNPIGITDSGVGGLTVVREVMRILPGEDILYFGDSANCPYGNKTKEQLLGFAGNMLSRLSECGIKLAALACNTTSSMIDELRAGFSIPLLGVIDPAARLVAEKGLSSVGLIATEFTANSKSYDRLIAKYSADTVVVSKGSPSLAALIDSGNFDWAAIDDEITREVNALLEKEKVKDIILACTHYPIVLDRFEKCFPNINFINPSHEQAEAVHEYLEKNDMLSDKKKGSLKIYTTGDPDVYADMCKKLGIKADEIVSL